MTKFTDFALPEALIKTLSECGYETPTPIQEQSLPLALAGKDLLLSAQTGSGKTAAFLLPLITKLNQQAQKSKNPTALILAPTRELAQQIQDSLRLYTKHCEGIYSALLVGGMPYKGQIQALKKGVSIVIATPGRLIDHLEQGLLNFSKLETLILDEADRMLDMGFSEDIKKIIDRCPDNRQTIMSSATWDGQVGKIAAKFTHDAHKILVKTETAHITESVYMTDNESHKFAILSNLLDSQEVQQGIIFAATKKQCELLAKRLTEQTCKCHYLHGDLPQHKRNRIIQDIRKGKVNLLVATDVAARGIDVPAISHIFNYDLPRKSEDYVHRIGRSGRAGRTGKAINLVSVSERSTLMKLQNYLKRDLEILQIEGLEPQAKARPDFAKKKPQKKFRSKARKNESSNQERSNAGKSKYKSGQQARSAKPRTSTSKPKHTTRRAANA